MSDAILEVEYEDYEQPTARTSRPTLAQVRALVEFLQKHPDLAHRKLRSGVSQQKVKKLWTEASNVCNSIEGTLKSTKGWMKFWADKRRSIMLKKKQIDEGTLEDTMSSIELKIYDLCQNLPGPGPATKKKKGVKMEPCNGNEEDDMDEGLFAETEELEFSRLSTEADERQLGIMEKLVEVMDQQAQAMTQMAQAAHNNSKAIERLAEASHMQALAVDRLASTFENINSSIHDVRNSIMNIDYAMKRPGPPSAATDRQNSNLFSLV